METKTRLSDTAAAVGRLVDPPPAEAQQLAPVPAPQASGPRATVMPAEQPRKTAEILEFESIISHSEEIGEFVAALAKAQGAFGSIERTLTGHVKGKTRAGVDYDYTYDYAPLDEVLEAVRPALSANGIAIMQFPTAKPGVVAIVTMLAHISGQWFRNKLSIGGPENGDPQEVGKRITYGRRYALEPMLGISPSHDSDAQGSTDRAGNGAQDRPGPVQMPQRETQSVPPPSAAAAAASRPSTAPPSASQTSAGFTVVQCEVKETAKGVRYWVATFSNGTVASVFASSRGGEEMGKTLTRARQDGTVFADVVVTKKNGYTYIDELILQGGAW